MSNDSTTPRPTILVTGARGRIASLLCPLWSEYFRVVPVSRTEGEGLVALADLPTNGLLQSVDVVVHTAWSALPVAAEANPHQCWEVDLPLLFEICEGAARSPSPPHLIFFSSGAVYGNCGERPSQEDDAPAPTSWYARSKLAAEEVLRGYAERAGVPVSILRITNAYGFKVRLGRQQGLISALLECARTGEPFTLWGDPEACKDYLHVEDLADAIRMLVHAGPPSSGVEILNVGSGSVATTRELVDLVEEVSGREILQKPPETASKFDWDLDRNLLDSARFKERTGWKPELPLRAGVEKEWSAME